MTLPIGFRARQLNDCAWWIRCAGCISMATSLLENEKFREFIALLNSTKVKFLIVGGHAVGGQSDNTGD